MKDLKNKLPKAQYEEEYKVEKIENAEKVEKIEKIEKV